MALTGGFRRRTAGSGSRRSKSAGTSSLAELRRRVQRAEAKSGKAPDQKSAGYGYEVEARTDRRLDIDEES